MMAKITAFAVLLLALIEASASAEQGNSVANDLNAANRGGLRSVSSPLTTRRLAPGDTSDSLGAPPSDSQAASGPDQGVTGGGGTVPNDTTDPPANDQVPCVTRKLTLEYSFHVAAPDDMAALMTGDYVSQTVQTVLEAKLLDNAVDCTKASVLSVEIVAPAIVDTSCSLEPTCFAMSAGIELDYTGPSDKVDKILKKAEKAIPDAFDTMSSSSQIEYVDAAEIPDDDGSDKGDDDKQAGDNPNTGGGTDDSSGGNNDDTTDGKTDDDTGKSENTTDGTPSDNPGNNSDGASGGKTDSSGSGKADGSGADQGTGNTDDDSTSNSSPDSPSEQGIKHGARVFVTCFTVAITLALILLIAFTAKKRMDQRKSKDRHVSDSPEQPLPLFAKDNQRLSPKDTDSTGGDNSVDSGFFHSPTKLSDDSSFVSDEYSMASSVQNKVAPNSLIPERRLPQQETPQKEQLQRLPPQYSSKRSLTKALDQELDSPPRSPQSLDTSTRSFSLQGSPILASGNEDCVDHSILYDVIMTPAGRITRVHVETFDAVTDREKNAKFYNNSDLLPRARSSPNNVSHMHDSSYASNDLSRSSNSSPYLSRSRSLFDCSNVDDTVDL